MLPTKFRFIWLGGFRGEDFKKSANQKQELPVVAMFVIGSGQNVHSLERTTHRCFLPSFGSFGQTVSEEKNFKNSQSETRVACGGLVFNRSGWNYQSLQRTFHGCFLVSFRSFGQAVSEEKILKNRPIRNKNYLWQPCLLMDRDEMSNLFRGPSIDAFYLRTTDDGRQVMAKAHVAIGKVS